MKGYYVMVPGAKTPVFIPAAPEPQKPKAPKEAERIEDDGMPAELRARQIADALRWTGRFSLEQIRSVVGAYYGIDRRPMMSASRKLVYARPRQVAMALARSETDNSLPRIGMYFGGRDHTTVMHAIRRVEELCREDYQFAREVAILRDILFGIKARTPVAPVVEPSEVVLVWKVSGVVA